MHVFSSRSAFVPLLIVLAGRPMLAQVPPKGSVVVDYTASTMAIDARVVREGATVRVRRERVEVWMKNANSALYDCSIGEEVVPSPDLAALQGFLKVLGPYLPEWAAFSRSERIKLLVTLAPGATKSDSAATRLAEDVRLALGEIERSLYGPGGLATAQARTALTIAAMRALPRAGDPASIGRELRDVLKEDKVCATTCDTIPSIGKLLLGFNQLASSTARLIDSLPRLPGVADRLKAEIGDLLQSAQGALADQSNVMGAAHLTRTLVQRVTHATLSSKCDDVRVSRSEGKAVTINITPSSIAEPDSAGNGASQKHTLTIHEEWPVRFSLGLAFVTTFNSRFDTFAARTAHDTTKIVVGGTDDRRFTYGLVLSATPRCLLFRNGDLGISFDGVLNPSDDVRAAGLGTSLTFKQLRIGVGHLWTKHAVLDRQALDQTLEVESDLRTRDTYDAPHRRGRGFYLSIGVTGWQPFVPGS